MIAQIFFSISPAILIVIFFYFQDRFKEPPILVLQAFFLGVMTIIPIVVFNNMFLDNYCWNRIEGSYFAKDFHFNMIRAAFQEEMWKFVVLYYFCSRFTDFNEPMDGIVYGVAVSLGFSAYENIEYVLNHQDYNHSWQTMAQIRVVPTIMHGTNGAIMGLLLSQVLFFSNNHSRLFLALFIPVLFHGGYNILISYFFVPTIVLLIVSVIIILVLVRAINVVQLRNLDDFEKISIVNRESINPEGLFNANKLPINNFAAVQSIFITLVLVWIICRIVIGYSPEIIPVPLSF